MAEQISKCMQHPACSDSRLDAEHGSFSHRRENQCLAADLLPEWEEQGQADP